MPLPPRRWDVDDDAGARRRTECTFCLIGFFEARSARFCWCCLPRAVSRSRRHSAVRSCAATRAPRCGDTTLTAALVVDSALTGFPLTGSSRDFTILAQGDTADVRLVVRFDTLPNTYRAPDATADSTIIRVDSATLNVRRRHHYRTTDRADHDRRVRRRHDGDRRDCRAPSSRSFVTIGASAPRRFSRRTSRTR